MQKGERGISIPNVFFPSLSAGDAMNKYCRYGIEFFLMESRCSLKTPAEMFSLRETTVSDIGQKAYKD